MPVRDQNPFGTCWAFSVMAASESSMLSRGILLSGGQPNFAERHLAYFTYNPVDDPLGNLTGDTVTINESYLDSGGNEKLAAYTLASWAGAVDETTAPYSELAPAYYSSSTEDEFLASVALGANLSRGYDIAHLTDMRQIPMTDRDDVKRAIMEHGALDASVMYMDCYLNWQHYAYYNTDYDSTNHAVTLVGWDDNFSKDYFGDEQYVQPYGSYDAPTSYQDLTLGSTAKVVGPEGDGRTWFEFTPDVDGSYAFWSYDCTGDPKAALYTVSETNGLLYKVVENDDSGEGNNFNIEEQLEAGRAYYLACTSYSGAEASYMVQAELLSEGGGTDLEYGDGTVEIPDKAMHLSLGSPQSATVTGPTTAWYRFTPTQSGAYQIGGSAVGGYAIYVYGVDSSSSTGQIGPVSSATQSTGSSEVPYSLSVNMLGGITYYLRCVASAGRTFDLTVSYEGAPESNGPSADGAWLVRNSWGEDWGDDGYFWVSYEDLSMNGTASEPNVASIFHCDVDDNFDNIYQYDGTCSGLTMSVVSGGSVANVFTAKANPDGTEQLQAVSFWVEDVNVDYSIQVYVNPTSDDDPTTGTAQLSQPVTGKTDYEGYYTIDLSSPVSLEEGDTFSVVITASHDDGSSVSFGIDESYSYEWVSFTSISLPGQSFATDWNGDWTDVSAGEGYHTGNLRIKAFTTNVSNASATPISDATITFERQWEYTGSAITRR